MNLNTIDTNPEMAAHFSQEIAFSGRAGARRLIEMEYANAPQPIQCDCGGTAWYKGTIGALRCDACGALFHSNGEHVPGTGTKIEVR